MDDLQSISFLRETLQTLQQENELLRAQAYESKLLFSGLHSLLALDDGIDPFQVVFSSLRDVFDFETACALVDEGEEMECIATTSSPLVGTRWIKSRMMRKVLNGRARAKLERYGRTPITNHPELVSADQPAMFLPIRLEARRGAIVLLRDPGKVGFTRDDVVMGQRFALLASHALGIRRHHLSLSENLRLQELTRILEYRALHDDLTGVGNRARLKQYVTSALAAREEDERLALIFVDIDRFKRINDYFGHEAGDMLLKAIAERLSAEAGEKDCVSRMSGDEFIIALSGVKDMQHAQDRLKRIRNALCGTYLLLGNRVDVTVSIGVSLCPENGETYADLRRNADYAMYRSKAERHGAVVFFSQEMGRALYSSMQLERLLREAVENKAFEAALQPKVRISDYRVTGFEALARWREDDGTVRSPGEFIRAASELGLLNHITMAVTEDALATFDRLDERFGNTTTISINIAGIQANDPVFMSELVAMVVASGRARRIVLELTEDAMVQAPQFRALVQPMLSAAGIRLAIDDFGTGYSSLSVIAELEAHELKIDRTFITNIHENPVNQRILRAIERLAQSMNLEIVAEGVEKLEELTYLARETSVDTVQGYYFSRPMSVPQAIEWQGTELPQIAAEVG
ncbi:bifunctional diguanylate cyclase/phosphodiesterase [Breoghania sp.]|uniref:putative bifunctional diguanylate cyclase/phosphodiesterase n=1 Tax=Breoghania sp. TaxID=2065378 RepID=UPI0029CA645F|nr:bifunctional diguanylate cyclase/phosphodiesterase [Breoghania sp.]